MKKLLKIGGIGLGSVFGLFVLAAALFYFPPFQNWAAKKAAAYASEKTGLEISVDRVRLKFPLRLGMEGVKVLQPNDSIVGRKDTIADVKEVVADVQFLPLLKKRIEIDQLDFNQAKINTTNLIKDANVKGSIGQLSVKSHGIDLKNRHLRLDDALIDKANLDIELADTAAVDTTKTPIRWKIHTDNLKIKDSKVGVTLADKETHIGANIGNLTATNGDFDLENGDYKLQTLSADKSSVSYDAIHAPRSDGLDTNHLQLNDLKLKACDIHYKEPRLDMRLDNLAFKEQSGLEVTNLSGDLTLQNGRAHLSGMKLETLDSSISTDMDIDLNTFDTTQPGQLNSHIHGKVSKKDLMRLLSDTPKSFQQQWPDKPLEIDGEVQGNLEHLTFKDMHAVLPGAFDAKITGFVENIDNDRRRKADIRYDVKTQNATFLNELLDRETRQTIHLPQGLATNGRFRMDGSCYDVDLNARQGGGTMRGNVKYCEQRPTYTANLTGQQFPLQNFLPNMNLGRFTGHVKAHGAGLDFLSPQTTLTADADIKQLQYDIYPLDNTKVVANMKNGWLDADVDMHNRMANGIAQIRAKVDNKTLNASILCDLTQVDCKLLQITDSPLKTDLCGYVDVKTNLDNRHDISGNFEDITIYDGNNIYRPKDVDFNINLHPDITIAKVDCADFHLALDAKASYNNLLNCTEILEKEIVKQYKERRIDHQGILTLLPQATLHLASGSDNFVMRLLENNGYRVKEINCDLNSSPQNGLNGQIEADSLTVEGIQLDKVKLAFTSDQDQINYEGQIQNYKGNPQYVFNALVDGAIHEQGTHLTARVYDENDKLGVLLGVNGEMQQGGIRFTPYGEDPVLGYKQFHVNEGNYIFLGNNQRISADLTLKADDGQGVQIYTNDDNTDAQQDITISLNRFDLEKVLAVIPYTPSISGQMNGDFHLIKTDKELSVASAVDFRNLVYEHVPMGNLNTEFVYIPKQDGSHYVDGYLYVDGEEVVSLIGTYKAAERNGQDHLDANLEMNHTPMSLLNGFIDEQVFGFEGLANGRMSVVGSLQHPKVDGTLQLDSAYLVSEPYGVRMRFDTTPINIENSHIVFDNFNMYGYNDSPLRMTGSLDISDMDRMMLDTRLVGRNFLLINAKENNRSETYGKAYVNMFATLKGPLSQLNMRGKLDVLGTTDLHYVLRDSPLSRDNRLDELVQFVSLNDTTRQVVKRPPLSGFNMDLSVSIDEGAHLDCALNPDHSNYVDVIGGGNLRLQYDTTDDFRLTGRYTLLSGEMKYSLPVIPLKTFTIQDGSYLEFRGDAMNPTLNITATERTKSSVADESGHSRPVTFECGVVMTKTLNDMGLEFIINAPEDMTVNNQLAMMSAEERGKIAVTMLTTGMYLADGNTSGFSMNSALSAFLQSQINGIAGNALRTLDLSIGVDNTMSASGAMQTDYSFKFAKRLWNNRLNIQVGGKFSTGSDVDDQNQNLFNNVIFEYRLNQAASQYVKLFYERDRYDWLEGNVGEYGVGFVWKRNVEHFSDLFRFKEKPKTMPRPVKRDSVGIDTLKIQPHEQ